MITAYDPALKQRPESLDGICVSASDHVLTGAMPYHPMIHVAAQEPVAAMLVGRNELHALAHGLAHETIESRGIGVLNHSRYDHSLASDCADDCDLALGSGKSGGSALAGVHIVRLPADEGFVHFHFAFEQIDYVASHCGAPAHADVPSCSVVVSRVFAEDHAMYLECAHSLFADENQVGNPEPCFQRNFCILKNGSSDHAEPIAVLFVASNFGPFGIACLLAALANPIKRSGLEREDLHITASGADRSVRPANVGQKLLATFFGWILLVEGIKCLHAIKYRAFLQWCQQSHNHLKGRGRGLGSYAFALGRLDTA
jgi:hypothetical protein